jgi:nicotinate phosphoribosyltransferase
MTCFDGRRLTQTALALDVDGLRRGYYSDRYFTNVVRILEAEASASAHYRGRYPRVAPTDLFAVGDVRVEAQAFMRRAPAAVVGGVDAALAMLRHCAGTFEGEQFVETWADLQVEAIEDGMIVPYGGQADDVRPVLRIRGRYRDFALLETPILGYLTRISRVATSVYEAAQVANGKPILFFPARFDLPAVQAADGYAYWLGLQAAGAGRASAPLVSTDAQGAWWGGAGGGTIPHALMAAYLSDTAEATAAFARVLPPEQPRTALVDFNNDVIGDSLCTLDRFWQEYRQALQQADADGMRRWTLGAVRVDTSPSVRDRSLEPGDPAGVSVLLTRRLREALDQAWQRWTPEPALEEAAMAYCRAVRIVVTGGFSKERIAQFEAQHAPVDAYGVGSTFLRNDADTNTDFTLDVVQVWLDGRWTPIAKVGRQPNTNAQLVPVDLAGL